MPDYLRYLQELLANFTDWLREPGRPVEFAIVGLAMFVTWALLAVARTHLARIELKEGTRAHRALHSFVHELLAPTLCTVIAGVAALVLSALGLPGTLARVLAMLALALLVVRLMINGIRQLSVPGSLLAASEPLIVWVAWPVTAMLLLGWLEPALQALDAVAITIAGARFSLLDALQTLVTVLVFVVVAAYAGGVIERRLMAAQQVPIGVRVGTAKATRLALIVLAVLFAFNLLGVDLGGLAVFSGALGVGIGFGLQRIASNFVSGFILIGDRSIRPGDVITIGQRFGVVRELRARYVVVRDRDGVDTLIPNENIITSEVINWSYADRSIRLKMPVQISYQDDPRAALGLMTDAARAHPRVEGSPEPVGRVTGFGESGIDLELRYWIRDPEDGINNIRSDLYLAIWDAFKDAGISIPYPQRDVHLRAAETPAS
ncbi:MAG: mechanosensitive ion channel [Gammaproteobacteria bacterium]|nr:mechanosensitive ion channel [Gammaproteobacteria bacterium]MDH4255755.1 mechanosensitive ion channel [Gammaproteobacteria bacterium]MDH5273826.1 mechanosensitive ion channel [Gammaproteobacteria bacterium]